ncbi:unnamed protein product, partial [Schistosoma turkestanicum]
KSQNGLVNSATTNYLNIKQEEDEESIIVSNNSEFVMLSNISLNNGFMILRRIANHPFLTIERPSSSSHTKLSNSFNSDLNLDFKGNEASCMLTFEQKELIESSGKTLLLDRLLQKLIKSGHKVVIFSQFTAILDLLEEMFDARLWSYVRLDGSTRLNDRQDAIRRFNDESIEQLPIFLISTKAGGCGINLQTAADTVIIFDSDWNPQTDLQAQDRCHRIGQTKPVLVIRLITNESVDENILQRSQTKRWLERLLLNHRISNVNPSLYDKSFSKDCQSYQLTTDPTTTTNNNNNDEDDDDDDSNNEKTNNRMNKFKINRPNAEEHFQTIQLIDDQLYEQANLTKSELIDLLKQIDYSTSNNNNVTDACSLTDDELNKLLDRSDLIEAWTKHTNNEQHIANATDQQQTDCDNSRHNESFNDQLIESNKIGTGQIVNKSNDQTLDNL